MKFMPLGLPTAETGTFFANDCPVPLRQGLDKLVQVRCLGSSHQLPVSGIRSRQAQVRSNGVMEKIWILRNPGNLFTPGFEERNG